MTNAAWAGQGVPSPLAASTGLVGPTDASAAERAARTGADLSLGRSNAFLPFGNRTGTASSLISTPALDALGTRSLEERVRAATTCQRPPEVAGCASCDGAKKRPVRASWNSPLLRFGSWLQHHKMTREEKHIQRRLEALMRKREAGEHLSGEDREFLKRVSAKSPKGTLSFAAGYETIVHGPRNGAPLGGQLYHETAYELTSEDGFAVRDETGVERKVGPHTTFKGRSSTAGDQGEKNLQIDQGLAHRGPVHFEGFTEYSPEEDKGGVGVKAKMGSFFPVARGGGLERGVYAQARLNILSHEERQAAIARELTRDDDMQSFQERRDGGRAEALKRGREDVSARIAANETLRNENTNEQRDAAVTDGSRIASE